MTWHTFGSDDVGVEFKKLVEDLHERGVEHKERPPVTPTDIWLDDEGNQRVRAAAKRNLSEPPYISPVMRTIIDKISREISE